MNNLQLSDEARKDLADIKAYIAEELESPEAAIRAVGKITKRIRILREHAYAGAPLSSVANAEKEYRFLVCGNYLVFYRVCKKDIFVDRILYGRRDYLRILFREEIEEI